MRNFRSLFEKIGRYLKGRPKTVLQRASELAALLKHQQANSLCLILDHDLGGGATNYRERLVGELIQEGRTVLILTYHVATLAHVLIVRNRRMNERYAIPNASFILDAVEYLPLKEIIYNTGVSFAQPEDIPSLLIALKAKTSACLKVLLHDYFPICPSQFLLDREGRFCRIPDISVCTDCLPKNDQGFTTLFAARDIRKWRLVWGALLASADEIVAFSNSTAELFRKVYPQTKADRISIVPHRVEQFSAPVHVKRMGTLCIGVVGMIGFHKGAEVIRELANEIKQRGLGLKIIVIGSIEASCDPGIVSQTGPFEHRDLPRTLEKSGANVILFPSICPETFSYVVHELVNLKMPVASFDFGAPAERLSSYEKGLVLTSMDPADILDHLISFHREIYLAN